MIYGDKCILKLIRRIEEGPNPEVEISAVLQKNKFEFVPKLLGTRFLQSASSRTSNGGPS